MNLGYNKSHYTTFVKLLNFILSFEKLIITVFWIWTKLNLKDKTFAKKLCLHFQKESIQNSKFVTMDNGMKKYIVPNIK